MFMFQTHSNTGRSKTGVWRHPHFLRDDPSSLRRIERIPIKNPLRKRTPKTIKNGQVFGGVLIVPKVQLTKPSGSRDENVEIDSHSASQPIEDGQTLINAKLPPKTIEDGQLFTVQKGQPTKLSGSRDENTETHYQSASLPSLQANQFKLSGSKDENAKTNYQSPSLPILQADQFKPSGSKDENVKTNHQLTSQPILQADQLFYQLPQQFRQLPQGHPDRIAFLKYLSEENRARIEKSKAYYQSISNTTKLNGSRDENTETHSQSASQPNLQADQFNNNFQLPQQFRQLPQGHPDRIAFLKHLSEGNLALIEKSKANIAILEIQLKAIAHLITEYSKNTDG
jgi:hypothetical protein